MTPYLFNFAGLCIWGGFLGCALVGGRRGRRGCLRWSKCDALQAGLQLDALPCSINSAINIKIESSIDIINIIGEIIGTASVMMSCGAQCGDY